MLARLHYAATVSSRWRYLRRPLDDIIVLLHEHAVVVHAQLRRRSKTTHVMTAGPTGTGACRREKEALSVAHLVGLML